MLKLMCIELRAVPQSSSRAPDIGHKGRLPYITPGILWLMLKGILLLGG